MIPRLVGAGLIIAICLSGCSDTRPGWIKPGIGEVEAASIRSRCERDAKREMRERMAADYRDLTDRAGTRLGGPAGTDTGFEQFRRDQLAGKETQIRDDAMTRCMQTNGFTRTR